MQAVAVQRKRWLKPDGILKLNTDGAFSKRDKTRDREFVIRNEGQVLKAGAGCEDLQNAFHGKLLGLLSRLIIETDAFRNGRNRQSEALYLLCSVLVFVIELRLGVNLLVSLQSLGR
jgi:hypothetical protein